MSGVDDEAGKIVRESLQSFGVTVMLSTRTTAVERPASNEVVVHLLKGQNVTGSELVVAAGLQAKLQGLVSSYPWSEERHSLPEG